MAINLCTSDSNNI